MADCLLGKRLILSKRIIKSVDNCFAEIRWQAAGGTILITTMNSSYYLILDIKYDLILIPQQVYIPTVFGAMIQYNIFSGLFTIDIDSLKMRILFSILLIPLVAGN